MSESKSEYTHFLSFVKKYRKAVFFIFSIFFLCCFFFFSLLVKKHLLTQFDFNMSVHIQDDTPVKLDKLYQFFSSLASIEGMAIILAVILILQKKFFRGIAVFLVFLASHIIELFGKVFINHPPPPFMFYKHLDSSAFNFSKYYVQTGNSYPSGHSFRTVFVAFVFMYIVFQIKRLPVFIKVCCLFGAFMIICLVGISRVSLGEHWTSDVIGGVLFGAASGVFSFILL